MWTEQTVETLKKFAFEGRSASWIAAALGAPSRNAVIGKANRIGIKLNGGTSGRESSPVEPPPPPPDVPWRRTRAERRSPSDIAGGRAESRARSHALSVCRNNTRVEQWSYAASEVGEMRRVRLMEIGEVECRWPVGDPAREDFAYCGLPVARGHAYCAGHCRLAYRRTKARIAEGDDQSGRLSKLHDLATSMNSKRLSGARELTCFYDEC